MAMVQADQGRTSRGQKLPLGVGRAAGVRGSVWASTGQGWVLCLLQDSELRGFGRKGLRAACRKKRVLWFGTLALEDVFTCRLFAEVL